MRLSWSRQCIRSGGFTLLELMIALSIAAVVLGMAVTSFNTAIANTRIKGVAESVRAGLLTARSEAIKRNAPVRFQLVSNLANTCVASATAEFWLVTQQVSSGTRGVATGACGAAPNFPEAQATPGDQEEPCPTATSTCMADPWIVAKSDNQSVTGVQVVATPATATTPPGFVVTFGPMGQLLNNLEGAKSVLSPAYTIDVQPAAGSAGNHSYRVQISTNGGIKLCDPAVAATDAMVCPS